MCQRWLCSPMSRLHTPAPSLRCSVSRRQSGCVARAATEKHPTLWVSRVPHPTNTSSGHSFVSKVQLCNSSSATVTTKWKIMQKASMQARHPYELCALFASSRSLHTVGIVRMAALYLRKVKQHKGVDKQKTTVLSSKKFILYVQNMREGSEKKNM